MSAPMSSEEAVEHYTNQEFLRLYNKYNRELLLQHFLLIAAAGDEVWTKIQEGKLTMTEQRDMMYVKYLEWLGRVAEEFPSVKRPIDVAEEWWRLMLLAYERKPVTGKSLWRKFKEDTRNPVMSYYNAHWLKPAEEPGAPGHAQALEVGFRAVRRGVWANLGHRPEDFVPESAWLPKQWYAWRHCGYPGRNLKSMQGRISGGSGWSAGPGEGVQGPAAQWAEGVQGAQGAVADAAVPVEDEADDNAAARAVGSSNSSGSDSSSRNGMSAVGGSNQTAEVGSEPFAQALGDAAAEAGFTGTRGRGPSVAKANQRLLAAASTMSSRAPSAGTGTGTGTALIPSLGLVPPSLGGTITVTSKSTAAMAVAVADLQAVTERTLLAVAQLAGAVGTWTQLTADTEDAAETTRYAATTTRLQTAASLAAEFGDMQRAESFKRQLYEHVSVPLPERKRSRTGPEVAGVAQIEASSSGGGWQGSFGATANMQGAFIGRDLRELYMHGPTGAGSAGVDATAQTPLLHQAPLNPISNQTGSGVGEGGGAEGSGAASHLLAPGSMLS
ncbi:hypothetical protein B484DRAFT_444088 [Ochromonadaceae sp. CCMP2298]|nr:hypothetical protein B484DRAFT_444088 [Ochromonadaceae sp. CCMP2298]